MRNFLKNKILKIRRLFQNTHRIEYTLESPVYPIPSEKLKLAWEDFLDKTYKNDFSILQSKLCGLHRKLSFPNLPLGKSMVQIQMLWNPKNWTESIYAKLSRFYWKKAILWEEKKLKDFYYYRGGETSYQAWLEFAAIPKSRIPADSFLIGESFLVVMPISTVDARSLLRHKFQYETIEPFSNGHKNNKTPILLIKCTVLGKKYSSWIEEFQSDTKPFILDAFLPCHSQAFGNGSIEYRYVGSYYSREELAKECKRIRLERVPLKEGWYLKEAVRITKILAPNLNTDSEWKEATEQETRNLLLGFLPGALEEYESSRYDFEDTIPNIYYNKSKDAVCYKWVRGFYKLDSDILDLPPLR